MAEKQLTVVELIDLLETMPVGALVYVEGLRYYGKAVAVHLDETDGTVVIEREDTDG